MSLEFNPAVVRIPRALSSLTFMALSLTVLIGCGKKNEPVAPKVPEVTVSAPLQQPVTDYLSVTGLLEGVETIEIRARVKGYLQAINAPTGSAVKTGDVLFTIDAAPYLATLRAQQANLSAAKAQAKNALVNSQRMQGAFNKGAISSIEFDKYMAERDVSSAQVMQMESAVKAAQLDVDYTHVKAPVAGRVGLNRVDIGALVGAGDATLLTTLVRSDMLKVRFDLTESQVQTLLADVDKRMAISGLKRREEAQKTVIELAIGENGEFLHKGHLFSAENTLDSSTGTLKVEARFDNASSALIPGSFVRMRVLLGNKMGVLVPEVAVGRDQGGTYLLVVDAKNTVSRRDVELGVKEGQLIRINKGLQGNERVVVNGLQKARVGSQVTPKAAAATSTSQAPVPATK